MLSARFDQTQFRQTFVGNFPANPGGFPHGRARFAHFKSRFLCFQYNVVNGLLLFRKSTVGGNGAGDVGGVAVVFGPQVHEHQIGGDPLAIVFHVMQHAGVVPGTYNRRVTFIFRTITAKNKLVDAPDFHFRHGRMHGFHHFHLALAGYIHCFAQQFEFGIGFDHAQLAHFASQGTSIQVFG